MTLKDLHRCFLWDQTDDKQSWNNLITLNISLSSIENQHFRFVLFCALYKYFMININVKCAWLKTYFSKKKFGQTKISLYKYTFSYCLLAKKWLCKVLSEVFCINWICWWPTSSSWSNVNRKLLSIAMKTTIFSLLEEMAPNMLDSFRRLCSKG